MVRHHVKKKKQKQSGSSKGGEKEQRIREKLSHLDQFAGSSDEDDDVGNPAPRGEEEKAASAAASEGGREGGARGRDEAMRRPSPGSTDKAGIKRRGRRARKPRDDEGDDDGDSDADDHDHDLDEDEGHDDHSDGDDEHDDGEKIHDDEGDDDGEHRTHARGTLGMANAMARILGTTPTASTPAAASVADPADAADGRMGGSEKPDHRQRKDHAGGVVLSRTTTKLQKMAAEDRAAASELRRKRRDRKRENLVSLHVPLSKADAGAAKEIEEERAHRRIATRGVVALFNAIATHQQQKKKREEVGGDRGGGEGEVGEREGKGEQQQNLTKRKFLEMIKESSSSRTGATAGGVDREPRKEAPKKGAAAHGGAHSVSSSAGKESSGSKIGWKALQEDYMMGSNRLKDWDKEDSDESSDADDA